jgi:non-specific serine/threonine protein kinase
MRYLRVLLRLAQHWRTHGDYARTIQMAQQILALEPAEEEAHQHLIFCYAAIGNRSAARQQYEAYVRALREELDVEPSPETVALYRRSQQALSRTYSSAAAHSNLPIPLASFIGRTQEIIRLKALLLGDGEAGERLPARLIAITGPGGCGKTRLAIQVARELLDAYPNGVWWVEPAALSDPTQVPQEVAKVFDVQQGVQPSLTDVLTSRLRTKQWLLVLDNCEHLVAACAELAERLLNQCLDLQILATSREALGIFGEISWLVPSLALPRAGPGSPAEYPEFEGIRLFVERASAVQRNFAITAANAPAILQICRQLDGIPLAIELAAARVKLMTVEQIATRLAGVIGARFDLLTDGSRTVLPRQQTLRAALDWSYDLLTEPERTLLRWLAVFAGGWTLEAAEAMAGYGVPISDLEQSDIPAICNPPFASGETPDLLMQLVQKSLVVVDRRGAETRYRLLDTIREYAFEKLSERGELEAVCRQHALVYLTLAEAAVPHVHGKQQLDWLARLEQEHDNLRAALTWCQSASGDAMLGLRLVAVLWQFWRNRYISEGQKWLESMLHAAGAAAKRGGDLCGGTKRVSNHLVQEGFLFSSSSWYNQVR